MLSQVNNQYDGGLAYADYWVGRFVEDLKSQGLYDDTLLIVTSDHGEFFGDHALLEHGVGLYEGGVRIPILVKYPGGAHAGEVIDRRVSIIDIFATVFDVLKLPMPDCTAQALDKVNHPIIAEDYENSPRVAMYGDRFKRSVTAAYVGDLKYMESDRDSPELYDLAADPGETNNLAASRPADAVKLAAAISDWRTKTAAFDGTAETARRLSPETLDKLRSLGYIGAAPR